MMVFLMLVAIAVVEAQPREYNNHYYVLSDERDYWQNARSACEGQGGYIVSINDDGERDFLYALYDQLNPPTNIWIGLRGACYNTSRRCDTFVWEDGNPWNYFNWHSDYPATGKYSNYVQIDKETKQWKNVRSRIARGGTGDKRFYICEFVDSCLNPSNSCQNGGLCSAIERWRRYECNCTNTGYVGTHCEVEVDECESNPCVHGLCTDGLQRYRCDCQGSGYTGLHCETDINECASQSCFHGICIGCRYGICENTVGSFQCRCLPGISGRFCSEDVDECLQADACNFHGSCTNTFGFYNCSCFQGFGGETCEHKTQPINRDDSYKIGFILCICLLIPFIAASVVFLYLWKRRTTPIQEKHVIEPESCTGSRQERSTPALAQAGVELELGETRYQNDTLYYLACGDTGTGELLEKRQYEQLQSPPTDTYKRHNAEPYTELNAVANKSGGDIKTYSRCPTTSQGLVTRGRISPGAAP